ncbi:MAG: 4Fe-4S dicluster domain-containing protein [Candidatus Omnitrophica bacterium]|nr:4Fe-4S dicluster domain-containing protein [Candidatus Omnitrophota bacterium]
MPDVAQERKGLSRRDLLKMSGVAVAGAVAATLPTKDAFANAKHLTGRRLAMAIDLDKCTGCHACSVSCKSEFDVPLGVWRSWVKVEEKGTYPNTGRFFLPRLCNHCDDPPCKKVCPTGATGRRDDGIVKVDEKKCVGCKLCIVACPYDARFSHPTKKVANKCDFCRHRVDKGVVPSCVNACPANARIFGDLNDPDSDVSKLVSRKAIQTLRPELGTEPHVFYISAEKLLEGGERR